MMRRIRPAVNFKKAIPWTLKVISATFRQCSLHIYTYERVCVWLTAERGIIRLFIEHLSAVQFGSPGEAVSISGRCWRCTPTSSNACYNYKTYLHMYVRLAGLAYRFLVCNLELEYLRKHLIAWAFQRLVYFEIGECFWQYFSQKKILSYETGQKLGIDYVEKRRPSFGVKSGFMSAPKCICFRRCMRARIIW